MPLQFTSLSTIDIRAPLITVSSQPVLRLTLVKLQYDNDRNDPCPGVHKKPSLVLQRAFHTNHEALATALMRDFCIFGLDIAPKIASSLFSEAGQPAVTISTSAP